MFIDGNLVSSEAYDGTINDASAAVDLYLGRYDSFMTFFDGGLAGWGLWNAVKTSADCKTLDPVDLVVGVPLAEGFGADVFDISGNGRHSSIQNFTLTARETQDNFHYNLRFGFELYSDGTNFIRVPYKRDGTLLTPVIPGFTKQSNNTAGYWHNNAETKIKQSNAPQLILNDVNETFFDGDNVAKNLSNFYLPAYVKNRIFSDKTDSIIKNLIW